MKKTILDPAAHQLMLARIAKIQPESPALWGKMTAAQCLCHLADQLRLALGEVKVTGTPSFMGRTVVKTLVLWGMPAPKGKVPTLPELDQRTAGTKPTSFEADRQILVDILAHFLKLPDSYAFQTHSIFGDFDKRQWARMIYIHLDHHLKQFGC